MTEHTKRTELSELGEFGLIRHLTENIKLRNPSSLKGVGDDAAVIEYANKCTIVTTDMLVEGIHFDLSYCPLKHLGYKAAAVNFSDVYAMNAQPRQLLVSLATSNRFSVEALDELYSGILLACENYEVDLVGGDTSSSHAGLILSLTAIGEAEKEEIVYRNTAREHDLLCVSGDLGAAYIGLQILEREKIIFKENPKIQPDLAGHDYVLERQLKPEARQDIIRTLKNLRVKPTAMIDISDGLASEIFHICTQSGKGCSIYEEKIPVDAVAHNEARELGLDSTICALNGGEDYELLFTIAQGDYEKIKNAKGISIIGHITDKTSGINLISRSGTQLPLAAQGWDAFLKREDKKK